MNKKPHGDIWILILWIVICFPVAIGYFFVRDWSHDEIVKTVAQKVKTNKDKIVEKINAANSEAKSEDQSKKGQ